MINFATHNYDDYIETAASRMEKIYDKKNKNKEEKVLQHAIRLQFNEAGHFKGFKSKLQLILYQALRSVYMYGLKLIADI